MFIYSLITDRCVVRWDYAANKRRISVWFGKVPSPEVRGLLKTNGFVYDPFEKIWTFEGSSSSTVSNIFETVGEVGQIDAQSRKIWLSCPFEGAVQHFIRLTLSWAIRNADCTSQMAAQHLYWAAEEIVRRLPNDFLREFLNFLWDVADARQRIYNIDWFIRFFAMAITP